MQDEQRGRRTLYVFSGPRSCRTLPFSPLREQCVLPPKVGPSFTQLCRSSSSGHHCSIPPRRACANLNHSSHMRVHAPVQLLPLIQSSLCAGPAPRHLGALLHLMHSIHGKQLASVAQPLTVPFPTFRSPNPGSTPRDGAHFAVQRLAEFSRLRC